MKTRCLGFALLLVTYAVAGTPERAVEPPQVIAISKPPTPLLPSDPPQGLVFGAPFDLTHAEPIFSSEGGPRDLSYLILDGSVARLTFDDGPDPTAPGGVMAVEGLLARPGGRFDPARDTLLSGAAVGLVEPKDLLVAGDALVVADFGGAALRVFARDAVGDVPPRFVAELGTTETQEPRRPWGLAYDELNDRLFVGATDGVVAVFDRFLERAPAAPDRLITPTLGGEKASANLHELEYLPEQDTLIILDVGPSTTPDEPGWDENGMIHVLEGASTADGPTPLRLRVRGPATLLGNPVGLAWAAPSLFVAESARSLILRFDDLLTYEGELELAPAAAVTVVRPESVRVVSR